MFTLIMACSVVCRFSRLDLSPCVVLQRSIRGMIYELGSPFLSLQFPAKSSYDASSAANMLWMYAKHWYKYRGHSYSPLTMESEPRKGRSGDTHPWSNPAALRPLVGMEAGDAKVRPFANTFCKHRLQPPFANTFCKHSQTRFANAVCKHM